MRPRWFHESRSQRVLATHYPFGIARRTLGRKIEKPIIQNKVSPVLFVASYSDDGEAGARDLFTGTQGELLAKAITQGLKWNLDSARITYIFSALSDSSVAEKNDKDFLIAKSALQDLIGEIQPRAIVALGHEAMRALGLLPEGGDSNLLTPVNTRWISHPSNHVLCTHDLRDVLSDSESKKAFWQDLKFLGAQLAS